MNINPAEKVSASLSTAIQSPNRSVLHQPSRRTFLKASAASLAAATVVPRSVFAAGSDKIRIGLVGCGGRGMGAAMDCLIPNENIEIVAIADLFKDRIDAARELFKKNLPPEKFALTDDRCFTGFDGYKHVIASNADVVLLVTPAHFRALHLRAAVEAGKHTFVEKPVAVDPVGARSIMTSADLAAKKNLAIVAGTQRRRMNAYREIMKRVHDGAIGELVAAQCYWMRGPLWVRDRQPGWSDMEWQIRNYPYFTWLCGDVIVETLIHNIDIVNWAFNAPPVSVVGTGSRQVRTEPKYGHIYDNFAVEYTYGNGARTIGMVRELLNGFGRMEERIVGTKGVAFLASNFDGVIAGEKPYHCKAANNPLQLEHVELIASIRAGKPLNEGRQIAETTLTAIMGRMSAYTGQQVTWDWVLNRSQLDLTLPKYEFGPMPVPPVAVPGITQLI